METTTSALGQEWAILQNHHESYEKTCLGIKLTCVVLCIGAVMAGLPYAVMGAVVALLWGQEGIVRTSQARLALRLVHLETLLRSAAPAPGTAFQLHTQWLEARPGAVALLREYGANACRPTVAFPYAIGVLVAVVGMARG